MKITITRQDILAHTQSVPWSTPYQVEQDLLLCKTMAAIFNDDFLSTQIAMRGGTLLHKVYLTPASRYSEDIDLVSCGETPSRTYSPCTPACLGRCIDSSSVTSLYFA